MSQRLAIVQIHNIKGIEYFEFNVKAVTVIRGRNGAGKSSVIDAISAIFEGGHDPDLIRTGAKEGHVRLILENGTAIQKVVRPKDSALTIKTKDGGKVSSAATFVKSLTAGLRFNPAQFITMTGKERAAELSKVMPINFQGQEVNAAANEAILADSEMIDLRRFTEIRDGRYASRTDVAREQTTAEGFIVATEQSLPAGTTTSWSGLVEMLRAQVSEAKAGLEREKGEIENQANLVTQALKENRDAKLTRLREAYDAAVLALNSEYQADHAKVIHGAEKEIDALRAASGEQLQELTASLAKAEQSLADQNRVEGQRAQLEKMRTTAQGLQKRWAQLDGAVKGLDRLKSEKLATLPVPGVEVRVDEKNMPEVYVEGVAWPHVNKSMQCKIAITIAAQALGDLPLMVLDESEVLDEDSLQLLIDAAKALGLQIIMARVETGAELTAVEA